MNTNTTKLEESHSQDLDQIANKFNLQQYGTLVLLASAFLHTYPYLDCIDECVIEKWVEDLGKEKARAKWIECVLDRMRFQVDICNVQRISLLGVDGYSYNGFVFPEGMPAALQ